MMNTSPRFDPVPLAIGWGGLALLLYLVFAIASPMLTPLAWGGVIAIVFYPLHARFAPRWGTSRAAAFTTVVVAFIVVVPLLVVMVAFVREGLHALGDLERRVAAGDIARMQAAWARIAARIPGEPADVTAAVADVSRRAALALAGQSGAVLQNTASFLFGLFFAHFAAFFLLRDSAAIMRTVRRLLPLEPDNRERLLAQTRELVSLTITSSAIVAAVQGFLGGLVFAGVGIGAPIFWGVVMGFLCLLPFGAGVVWLPAAILLWVDGSPGRAITVAALGLGIVSSVDNVLRPMLLSGRTQMNGLVVFISLLGGLAAFGALGLVLGPLLVSVVLALVTAYVDQPEDAKP